MSIIISLVNGIRKELDHPMRIAELAAILLQESATQVVAAQINTSLLVDLDYLLAEDARVRFIVGTDPEGLEIIRHSTAHLLAQAVKLLFPTAQMAIGPVIAEGFYYDFAFEQPFSCDDLKRIEQKMREIVERNLPISHRTISHQDAIDLFRNRAEQYKLEIIRGLHRDTVLSIYQQGDFIDLCRGPHVPNTSYLTAFKLTKLSGAYWRGDSNNPMLQRIYGTSYPDIPSLNRYLHDLEEAEKRDHRKLAKAMDLFHTQEEAPGMIFWHPNGLIIYNVIKAFIRQKLIANDYEEVVTPQLVDLALWKQSGHWDNFKEAMFLVETEGRQFAIKPMNCPCHVQIFKQGLKSYRDLPIRLAEFGCVHRNELTGAMHGLMRVRQLTQDDAHIFCTEDQLQSEAENFIRLVLEVYQCFGFDHVLIYLATRPSKRMGSDELWDRAESTLTAALNQLHLNFEIRIGEGAFYGPKIEFHLRDCLNRLWQCGTLQLDYAQPAQLDATYITENGQKRIPVMLHRAILGSIERFIGILLEHYAGQLPVWLMPIQAVILNITDQQTAYVQSIQTIFKQQGYRVNTDLRNEKISFKIRQHTLAHTPYLLIVGNQEMISRTITVRTRCGQQLKEQSIEQCIALMQAKN